MFESDRARAEATDHSIETITFTTKTRQEEQKEEEGAAVCAMKSYFATCVPLACAGRCMMAMCFWNWDLFILRGLQLTAIIASIVDSTLKDREKGPCW